jgi:hypothetical protein
MYVLRPLLKMRWLYLLVFFLDLLFYSICLHVCFLCQCHAVFVTWLCSIIWNQVLWYLQHCCFYSGLLWLFVVICASIWISWLIFLFLWKMSLGIWWGLHWIYRLLLVVWPLSQNQFCWFINIGGLSGVFFKFLFKVYSFYSRDLSPP